MADKKTAIYPRMLTTISVNIPALAARGVVDIDLDVPEAKPDMAILAFFKGGSGLFYYMTSASSEDAGAITIYVLNPAAGASPARTADVTFLAF